MMTTLDWTLLSEVPRWVRGVGFLILLVTFIGTFQVSVRRAPKRPARERKGWKLLTPSLGHYLVSPLAIVLFPVFSVATVYAGISLFSEPYTAANWMLLVLGPPMIVLTGSHNWYTLFVRFRFNDGGVERRGPLRREFWAWNHIAAIKFQWFRGTQIVLLDGRRYCVSDDMRGFYEFIETAKIHGIAVAI